MDKEILRQIIHASGIFILVLGIFLKPDMLIILCMIIVIFIEIMFKLDQYHHVPIFSTIFSKCKRRDDERGFLYFFIGIILTLYFFGFNMDIANSAILMLLIGDSASTIIGKKFGRHKLPFNVSKSVEGSLAFFIVGFLCAVTLLPLGPAFFGALAGALTEAYSPIDDNIPVPVISALVMSVVIYWI